MSWIDKVKDFFRKPEEDEEENRRKERTVSLARKAEIALKDFVAKRVEPARQEAKEILKKQYKPKEIGKRVSKVGVSVGRFLQKAPEFKIPREKIVKPLRPLAGVAEFGPSAVGGAVRSYGRLFERLSTKKGREEIFESAKRVATEKPSLKTLQEPAVETVFDLPDFLPGGLIFGSIVKESGEKIAREFAEKATKGIAEKAAKETAEKVAKVPIEKFVPEKLKVGGGRFALERFNVTKDVDDLIRKTAKEIEPAIKVGRRGKVSWEKTMKDAESISIAQILDRKRGQGVSDSYVAAASNHIKAISDDISSLTQKAKGLTEAGQTSKAIKTEIARQVTLYKALMTQTFGASAETGRALNAHKILAKQLAQPKEVLIKEVLKDAEGYKNIDDVVNQLMKFAPEDKQGMIKFLAEVKPSSPMEKIESVWYNNILSGTSTHLVNTIGNTARTMWHLATKPMRVGTDIVQSKLKGTPREEFMREFGPEVVGTLKGFKDGVRKALFTMRTGFRVGDVETLRVPRKPLKGIFGGLYSLPSRGLVAMDELFRGINKSMDIHGGAVNQAIKEGLKGDAIAKRAAELINAPTPEMIKSADKIAEELLFQKVSTELRAIGGLRDFVKFDIPKLGTVKPLRFVIPFIQIPINVAKFGWEVMPSGVATTLIKGPGKLGQKEFSRRMASGIMGTAALATLALHFTEGKITGRAPKGKTEKDAFYAEGKQPYSVRIGDSWVQYSRIDPLATWLTTIALWHDNFNETGEVPTTEKIQNFVVGFARGFADKTFLSGIGDLMNAIENPEQYGGSFTRRLAASLGIPWSSFLGSVVKARDRIVRKPTTIKEAMMEKIPGLAGKVPVRESEFEEGGVARRKAPGWQEFIPIKITKEKKLPEIETYRETKKLKKEAKERIKQEKETAQNIWNEIKDLSRSEQLKKISQYKKEGRITKKIYTKLKALKKGEERDWTKSEKRIYNLGPKEEAKYHWDKIKDLSSSEQKKYINDLKQRKLLTKETYEEIKKLK